MAATHDGVARLARSLCVARGEAPNGQQAMKDPDWTWKQVAIFVGLVFAMIGVAAITLWIVWNSPALLP
jgi:hypothetical protein